MDIESFNLGKMSGPLVCEFAAVEVSWPKRNEYLRMLGTYIPPRNDVEKTSEALTLYLMP